MAANQNTPGRGNQANFRATGQSPFFNQSLGGGLTVQNLSGPLLFTPVPLSSPSETGQPQNNAGRCEMSKIYIKLFQNFRTLMMLFSSYRLESILFDDLLKDKR